MAKNQDKTSDPGEVGTELDLPEDGLPEAATSTSNMSFGMVDLGGDEPAGEKLPSPEEIRKQPAREPKPQLPPKPSPQEESKPEVESARPSKTAPSKPPPAPYAIRPQRSTSPGGLPMAPAARLREEAPQTAEIRTSGRHSRTIKIALVVILALILVALGVFLFLKWRKNVELEREAELERLNQQSRDSLMDDRFE